MLPLLEGLFNGISIGSVLLISALGLAIVFGLMGVINLAHGELMMLGAYTTYVVQNVFKPLGGPWFDLYILFAVPMAFLVAGLVGLLLERGVIRSFQIPYTRLFIIFLTVLCLLATYWFLNRSHWGLRIRSVTQNRQMSSCLGIPTATVDALTFALGSGLAGIAGCAISLLGSVGPNTGQNYIIDTFMVVVVGGVGNLLGTIIAALAIGTINYLIGSGTFALLSSSVPSLQPITDLFNFFATTSMAKVLVFALIIAFLQVKPAGIFAPKGRTAEI